MSMSQRSKNHEEVNFKLMELNKKYIPEYDVILNTSPPRAGKTINTILYHIENKIPAIVFVDNEQQANDIKEDLREINEEYLISFWHWQSKKKLCHIFSNKDEIIEKEGREFFETIKFKYENNISMCKDCKYRNICEWLEQKRKIRIFNIVLMNKKNILTSLVDYRKAVDRLNIFFHVNIEKFLEDDDLPMTFFKEKPRTIIYDEKLEELHITKFKHLDENDFKLLNKLIELKKPKLNNTIHSDTDFINSMKKIRTIFINISEITELLKEADIDFSSFGKYKKDIYIDIFLQKIKTNIEIYDYLDNRLRGFPTIGGKYDWRFFTYEKLYIDVLFERNEMIGKHDRNKIILLDATPLKSIVEKLKRMEGLKEINVGSEIFDKNSSLVRINREGGPSMASREKIKSRTPKYKIPSALLQDKAYANVIKTGKYIGEFKKVKDIKFGVITYKQLKSHKKDKDPIEPYVELKKILKKINTLYFGNARGRSELNKCKIVHIVGTDRHPPISMYNLYRYLGGWQTWEELKSIKGRVNKLKYNDELFNEIINHQIDSEMEQVIFRNMPHMNKRLIILEGHFPKHLEEYFKEIANINMKPTTEKLLYPIVIEEFLKAVHMKKEFNFEEVNKIAKLSFDTDEKIEREFNKRAKEESVEKVIKLIDEYRIRPENYTFEKIYNILKEEKPLLLEKAKMGSFSSFKNKYNGKN